jgi:hypothetical protein
MDPNEIAKSALDAQWLSAWATVAAAILAGLFGFLTLFNFRLGRRNEKLGQDNQERATLTAASDPMTEDVATLLGNINRIRWTVSHDAGESWLLFNEGTDDAYDVQISGLTALDRQRLTTFPTEPTLVPSAEAVGFDFVSRFTLSGPGNLVVTYATEPDGVGLRKVVLVPAP